MIPEQIKQQAMNEIAKLPQRDVLLADPARVDAWLDKTYAIDPKRLMWHIARLGGIGGSEIGVGVMEQAGGVDVFETMRGVVAQKLMLATPARPNAAMMIGTALEDTVRQAVHDKFAQFDCATDTGSFDKLKAGLPTKPLRPWLIGNPDDILLLRGKRFIVDYKVTISDAQGYTRGEIPTRYFYQLHHYGLVLKGHDIPVHGLILAPYFKNADGEFELLTLNVPKSRDAEEELISAGDMMWRFVMDGVLPDYPKRPLIEVGNTELLGRLKNVAREYASYEAIASAASKRAIEFKNHLKSMMESYRFGDGKLSLAGLVDVNVSGSLDVSRAVAALGSEADKAKEPSQSIDMEKVAAFLKEQGIDLDRDTRFRKVEFNQEKLMELLGANGLDVSSFMAEDYRIGLARGKGDLILSVRNYANELIDHGFSHLAEMTAKADNVVLPSENAAEKPVKNARTAKRQTAEACPVAA